MKELVDELVARGIQLPSLLRFSEPRAAGAACGSGGGQTSIVFDEPKDLRHRTSARSLSRRRPASSYLVVLDGIGRASAPAAPDRPSAAQRPSAHIGTVELPGVRWMLAIKTPHLFLTRKLWVVAAAIVYLAPSSRESRCGIGQRGSQV